MLSMDFEAFCQFPNPNHSLSLAVPSNFFWVLRFPIKKTKKVQKKKFCLDLFTISISELKMALMVLISD
jgi:hypothetical protein